MRFLGVFYSICQVKTHTKPLDNLSFRNFSVDSFNRGSMNQAQIFRAPQYVNQAFVDQFLFEMLSL